MLWSNISPLSCEFQKNLRNMVKDLNEVFGKKYILKRKSRPMGKGGGFYYVREDSRLVAIVDKVFPSFRAPIVITGIHHGDTGELEINLNVRQKRYKPLVKKYIANFLKYTEGGNL